jgi:hypothetical protein
MQANKRFKNAVETVWKIWRLDFSADYSRNNYTVLNCNTSPDFRKQDIGCRK